jgi:hypothetical protein
MLITLKGRILSAIMLTIAASILSCGSEEPKKEESKDINTVRTMEHDELVKRGQYIVSTSGCNDCHSPKVFDANGMHVDTTKPLSGSPAGMPLPPISASSLQPGNWVLMAPNVTAFVGPWGISYAANLTPDSTTGLGTWSREMFIKTLRTGKHMGLEGGRPIMPPMPWYEIAKMTDDDISAIFAYLQSLPPVTNKVNDYVSPPEAAKLAK